MCEDEDICTESAESSINLMQNLRVGDSNCLNFFNSGANTHLIDGRMARQEDLQLISSKSIAISVIGGGSIKTEYGSFRFNLGPGEDGKYHEITAIGMDSVTAGFGEYDLKEVIKEYRSSATSEELEQILPETVGGSRVHLLLGIKNTRIQPTLIKVLPSGVGVYLSPFKDLWGSRIIFAGPNKEFMKAKKEQMRGSSHAVYLLNTEVIKDDMIENTKDVRFESKGKVQISLYKPPIEDDILQEMGFEPGFELEKYVDRPGFLANFFNTDEREHFCFIHKAVIPIARLRVLLDQDIVGDNVSVRCP